MTTELVAPRSPSHKSARWVLVVVGLALVGGGVWFARGKKQGPGGPGTAPSGSAADARPTSVVVAKVERRDVPVVLEGLGNAMPLATVTLHAQVDGRLESVAFTEGQAVKKGDVLARVDPRPFAIALHQAQAALARDTAQQQNAQRTFERNTALVQQGLATQQQLDDAHAQVDQLAGTLKTDQAQIENAQLQLDYASVRSPIDGVTGVRQVDPGNLVHAADPNGIVVITQLDPMAVIFSLPQDDLPAINQEIAHGLDVEAYGREGGELLGRGKLTLVDNQVNIATATIKLKATLPNPDKKLWPGALLRLHLLLAPRAQALTLPAQAVQRGPQGTFVYVVSADQTAQLRPVEIDSVGAEWAIVKRGVEAGEDVVSEGQNQLKPGGKVSARPNVGGKRAGGDANAAGANSTKPAASDGAHKNGKPSAGAAP
jgi:multidrug efflux system membrane fusion protein